MTAKEYASLYRDHLLEDIVPFWIRHSGDYERGGYFTAWIQKGRCMTQINSCGFNAARYGVFPCYITR
jgi:mannose/cellobiose epimerase-like protein (N-acyl-D-glucosamine 2-epimerase family)